MEIVWTRPAARDLLALRTYISERNPTAAESTAARILGAMERLIDFPASGRPGRIPNTRELVVTGTPFFVVYRVRHEDIELLRIIHGARRWP